MWCTKARLTEEQIEWVIARWNERYSGAEIAGALHIAQNAVSQVLNENYERLNRPVLVYKEPKERDGK